MKIYSSKEECMKAAEVALAFSPAGAFIDSGIYKGGKFECLFILHPMTGKTIFEGAFY